MCPNNFRWEETYTPTTLPHSRSPHNVLHSPSYYECEQTGFGRSTALFSSARSRLASRISPWCATLVWSTHGLVSAFFQVGGQFGTSRPNTLACGLWKRLWSFLMGVTMVTPNKRAESVKHVGRHGNRDRYSVDPGAVTHDVVVYTRHKRSPWCLKGGKVTVTVTPSLVCPRIRQRENRCMQQHPTSKSGPTTGSTAARLGKIRTARKIRILRGYSEYDTHIRHRGQRLDVLCQEQARATTLDPVCAVGAQVGST